jgi:hypothetical protein
MNANPDTSTSGLARLIVREDGFHEARLWSRARRNLTLLYAGRPGCCASHGKAEGEVRHAGSPGSDPRPGPRDPRAE